MNKHFDSRHLYDKKTRSLFTQIIHETESLYEKVAKKDSLTISTSSFTSSKPTSKNL